MQCEYCKNINTCTEVKALKCLKKEKENDRRAEAKRQNQLYQGAKNQYDRP